MADEKKMKQQHIKIELDEKSAEGKYSNFSIITHSAAEFIIDFTRILPGIPKSKVLSRIIMTPMHAKSLLFTLKDNIEKYEAEHGEIRVAQQPRPPVDLTPPPDTLPN